MDSLTSNTPVRRISLMPLNGNQINIISEPTWINLFWKSHPLKTVTRKVHFAFHEGKDRILEIIFFRNDGTTFINIEVAEDWLGAKIKVTDIEMVGQPIVAEVLFVIRRESCSKECGHSTASDLQEIDFYGPKKLVEANVIRGLVPESTCPRCGKPLDVFYVPN